MAEIDNTEFRCIVPFLDGSASFVHGFEAGMIWTRMEAGEPRIEFTSMPLHSENTEVFRRMASARGYDLSIDTDSDGWIAGYFDKRRTSFSVIEGGGNER